MRVKKNEGVFFLTYLNQIYNYSAETEDWKEDWYYK